MITIEYLLLAASTLIVLSVVIAKFSDNLGVPTLLLFLGIGMLAGSDGPGGIYFDDARLAQSIGIIALVIILFSGGLETKWSRARPVLRDATLLATVGVLLTAFTIAGAVMLLFGLTFLQGLLLGAIVSSTDAAAVFSVLRSRNIALKGHLQPLLEVESGSNDPMAVFLTIGTLQLMQEPSGGVSGILLLFVYQMVIGAAAGYLGGKAMVFALRRLTLSFDGIYPVFALACAGLLYSATALVEGSGFLAVYIAGIVAGNSDFVQKKGTLRFFDGLSWLGQIAMFLTLGLLVFPHQLVYVIPSGLLLSAILILIARPAGVFLSLALSRYTLREKLFISWVGLRGAVPIILATFPMLSGVEGANIYFNIVFFIVLTSAVAQGWSLPAVARRLGLIDDEQRLQRYPIEFAGTERSEMQLVELLVPYRADASGKPVVELGLPQDCLVVLISRNGEFLVPSGGTHVEGGMHCWCWRMRGTFRRSGRYWRGCESGRIPIAGTRSRGSSCRRCRRTLALCCGPWALPVPVVRSFLFLHPSHLLSILPYHTLRVNQRDPFGSPSTVDVPAPAAGGGRTVSLRTRNSGRNADAPQDTPPPCRR